MDKILQILAKSRLFFDIDPSMIEKSLPLFKGCIKHFSNGQIFLQEGDILDSLGILLNGKLCSIKIFEDGSQTIMQTLQSSYVVGADIICTKQKTSPCSLVAIEACDIYLFDYQCIFQPGRINEQCRLKMLYNLLELLSHENMRKHYKIEILSRKSLRERIIIYLTTQKHKNKSSTFTIPFNREQLAEYLCVNRSALSHELSLMKKEGLLTFLKNDFTLF
jgi:CRP-like cAMP-binding protein